MSDHRRPTTVREFFSTALAIFAVLILGETPSSLAADSQPAGSQHSISPERAADSLENDLSDTWFSISLQNQKVGFVHETTRRVEINGKTIIRNELQTTAEYRNEYASYEIEEAEVYDFEASPPYALVEAHIMGQRQGVPYRATIARSGTRYTLTANRNGESKTKDLPHLSFGFHDSVDLQRWVRQKPTPGDTATSKSLSILTGKTTLEEVSLVRSPQTTTNAEDSLYEIVEKKNPRGRLFLDDRGHVNGAWYPSGIQLKRVAETEAKASRGKLPMILETVPVDRPLGSPSRIETLILSFSAPASAIPEGSQQTSSFAHGRVQVMLGANFPDSARVSIEDEKKALEAARDYPLADTEFRAFAHEAVHGASAPREKVANAIHFVYRFIHWDDRPGRSIAEIRKERIGNCTAFAMLLTAVLRAEGVPTREVVGFVYTGDMGQALGSHMWNEVALDGMWVAVDASRDQLRADATHVKIDERNFSASELFERNAFVSVEKVVRRPAGSKSWFRLLSSAFAASVALLL